MVFYIYAPVYRSNSAGIKVLYKLCELINSCGGKAWIVLHNPKEASEELYAKFPILNMQLAKQHRESNLIPIAIYSETVVGNPLNAKNIVRYYLNFVGTLGGPKSFKKSEIPLAYSQKIAESLQNECEVLFIPAVDLGELPREVNKEDLNLVYAGKYRAFVGDPNYDYGVSVLEIFREGKNRQSRNEVLNLLAKANRIYVWENSTIATEAILLGTPVIFIKSTFLGEIIAEKELGRDGWTFANDESEIEKARVGTIKAKEKYLESMEKVSIDIRRFLQAFERQKYKTVTQVNAITIPSGRTFNKHRVKLFFSYVSHFGVKKAVSIVVEFGYVNLLRRQILRKVD